MRKVDFDVSVANDVAINFAKHALPGDARNNLPGSAHLHQRKSA